MKAMARPKTRFVFQACGSVSRRWQGQCPDCAEWNTLAQETAVESIFATRHDLSGVGRPVALVTLYSEVPPPQRLATGIAEADSFIGR